jgi:hypothetical protein
MLPQNLTILELEQVIISAQAQIEELKQAESSGFNQEFLDFLASGDIADLAPNGLMTPEMYLSTKFYVFADLEHVKGRTVLGRYLSGKHFTGVLPADSILFHVIQRGPCVVHHQNNQITGWLELSRADMLALGGSFNGIAAKSKKIGGQS